MARIKSITDNKGGDRGYLRQNEVTDDNSLLLHGKAKAGERIRIFKDGELIGTAKANKKGNWKFLAKDLEDGATSFTVSSVNKKGVVSKPSGAFKVVVDTSVDEASNVSFINEGSKVQQGRAISNGKVEVTGQAEADATVKVFNNGKLVATVKSDENGDWSTMLKLDNGEHNIATQVTDKVGNSTQIASSATLQVDPNAQHNTPNSNTSQDPPVVLPPDTTIRDGGYSNTNTPLISGVTNPNAIVTMTVGNITYGPVTANDDGTWEIQVTTPLPEGLSIFKAKAVDGDLDAFIGYKMVIDTEAPDTPTIEFAIDNVGTIQGKLYDQDHTDDDALALSGKGEIGTIIRVFNGNTDLGLTIVKDDGNGNGVWELTLSKSLTEGTHEFFAYALDRAGNLSDKSEEFEITVDRSIEAPTISYLVDDQGNDQSNVNHGDTTDDQEPKIVGRSEPNALVSVTLDGHLLAPVTADDNGDWELQLTQTLDDGMHTIVAVQVDKAGNRSGESDDFEFDVTSNIAPVAEDDSYTVSKEQTLNVLKNDSDPDGDPIHISKIVSQGNYGSARINNAGKLVFTPDGSNSTAVEDSIVYEISDGRGGFDTATVKITVLPPLDNPTIDLDIASDSGVSMFDRHTNVVRPTFNGYATAKSTIDLYAGKLHLGTTTVKADGSWSLEINQDLSHDIYDIHAKSSFYGQTKSSDEITVNIDTIVEADAAHHLGDTGNLPKYLLMWPDLTGFEISTKEEVAFTIKDIAFSPTRERDKWLDPGETLNNSGVIREDTVVKDHTIPLTHGRAHGHGDYTFGVTLVDRAGNVKEVELDPVTIDPIAALKDGGYVISYLQMSDQDGQGYDVFVQRYDANGQAVGSSIQVNTYNAGHQLNPDATGLSDGGYVISWQSKDQDGDLNGIYVQRFDKNNQKLGDEIQINTNSQGEQIEASISALEDGGFVISWTSDDKSAGEKDVYMRVFDEQGKALSSDILVNEETAGSQANSSISSLSDGRFIISWDSQNADGQKRTMAKIYDSTGKADSSAFDLQLGSQSSNSDPHISQLPQGGFAVSWLADDNQIYVMMYNANGEPTLEQAILVSRIDNGSLDKAEVAGLENGDIVVSWSAPSEDSRDILASRYTASGETVFENKLINEDQSEQQIEPHITALEGGGYLISWTNMSFSDSELSIHGKQFDANDNSLGGSFEVGVVSNFSELTDLLESRAQELNLAPEGDSTETNSLSSDETKQDSLTATSSAEEALLLSDLFEDHQGAQADTVQSAIESTLQPSKAPDIELSIEFDLHAPGEPTLKALDQSYLEF
ncbi:Ig-like domain-containing protein [uncultured Pseudoteredinibacter sp.]|uniref:Ig-like domain-containing protein n=1 Tax=uncultured Pseudoteredinibacter sp. TaxID=1641701 RepID=UPI002613EB2E|nr:Ig-like domain-containing protein [uncultured Pseudoteredinibacter sp.]